MVVTGAIFTMLPGSLLREIGISPTRKDIFELADGSRAEMEIGEMRVRFQRLFRRDSGNLR